MDNILSIIAIIISIIALFNSFLNDYIKKLIINFQIKHKPYDLIVKPIHYISYNEFKEKYNNWLKKINGRSERITIYEDSYYGIILNNKEKQELLPYVNFFKDEDIIENIYFTKKWNKLIQKESKIQKHVMKENKFIKRKLKYFTEYDIVESQINNFCFNLCEEKRAQCYKILSSLDKKKKIKKNSLEYWSIYEKAIDIIDNIINDDKKLLQILEDKIININSDKETNLIYSNIFPMIISISSLLSGIISVTMAIMNYNETVKQIFENGEPFVTVIIILLFICMFLLIVICFTTKHIEIYSNNCKLHIYEKKVNELNNKINKKICVTE